MDRRAAPTMWILALALAILVPIAGPPARGAGVHAVGQRPVDVDAHRLVADLQMLAAADMEGRRSGTAGNRRARDFILARFASLGLQPVGPSYEHPFALGGDHDAPQGPAGANLVAMVPGGRDPQRVILLSAHYDHIGVRGGQLYPGADDNASGVAVLLAAAASFARHPADDSVLFVAFDAEEQGLRGSRHFLARPPIALDRIAVVVNADMVGRGDAGRIVVAGTYHYPALKPPVLAAAKGRAIDVVLGHDRPARDSGVEDWTDLSDHAPFHRAGIPFLYFGVENHSDYHKPTDTADRVPREFFTEAARVIVETVRRLASPAVHTGASR